MNYELALHQHLADTSRTAEVAVNLEGRMGIEEVGVGAASFTVVRHSAFLRCNGSQQFTVYLMGFLPILQSCPEVDAPTRTPTCRLVAFDFKCPLAGLQQGICFSP